MSVDRKIIHDLKNQLTISFGLVEMVHKSIETNGSNIDLEKALDRLKRSLAAQAKMQDIIETHFKKEES